MAAESLLSRTLTNNQAMRVVLTRPAERQQVLAQHLNQAGCDVLSLPALTITPIRPDAPITPIRLNTPTAPTPAYGSDSPSTQSSKSSSNAGVAYWQPGQFDALVFVSRAAWQNYWHFYLQDQWPVAASHARSSVVNPGVNVDVIADVNAETEKGASDWPILACVGLATAKQIARDLNLPISAITYPNPDLGLSPDSEGLWVLLEQKLASTAGQTVQHSGEPSAEVLIVRGQTGRDWLHDTLAEHGVSVKCLSVYQREAADWSEAQLQTLARWATQFHNTGIWLITSAEGLAAIGQQYEQHGLTGKPGLQPQAVVVVHERLVAPVQQWLGQWAGAAGAKEVMAPIVVSTPDDQSIEQTILAVRLD